MNLNEKTALNIKEIRRGYNMSQTSMAKKLHISTSAYSRLENGEVQITLNILQHIAEILEVSIFELIGYTKRNLEADHFHNLHKMNGNILSIMLTKEEIQNLFTENKNLIHQN